MPTKIPAELSSTPGIADSSDATAITIDSSENVKFESVVGINKDVNTAVALSVGADATSTTSYGLEVTNSTANTRFLVNGEGDSIFYKTNNAEGMRFNATSGDLKFASGQGIDFSANANESGMTSELLDDYEEGTFTAGITGASGHAYSAQTATYTKIGRLVVANFTYVLSTAPTSGSNIYVVMPFVPTGSSTYSFGAPYSRISFPAGQTDESAIMLCTYAGTVNFYPYDRSSGAVYISYTNHAVGQYSCTVTYFTDS